MYHPPKFDPLHFEGAALPTVGQGATRWLSSWQSPADQPVEQVALGWGLDAETVIVVATSTLARLPHKSDRRRDAVFQALGGYQIGPVPLSPLRKRRAIERAWTVPDWEPVQLTADDQVCTGAASIIQGLLVGHARAGTRVVTFAARGLTADQIRLRTLNSADGYTIDPMTTQTPEHVEAQRPSSLYRP